MRSRNKTAPARYELLEAVWEWPYEIGAAPNISAIPIALNAEGYLAGI
jgi:hypothetical protein